MVYIVQSAHWAIESESKQCANILLAIRKMIKNDIGKIHTALANMWIIFRYLLILIFNIIPQWYENRLCMVSIPEISRPDIFASFFNICRYVSVSLKFIVYGNLNTICILLLSENCINLNYVELVHSIFQVYDILLSSVQFSSVTQSCPTLCDPMDCSTPGLPVHHQLPDFTQTHVHRVGDAIQLSHPLLSPSPPTLNLSQHQGLFKWVSSSHQVAKVLEFHLQHQSFQWIFRTDFL